MTINDNVKSNRTVCDRQHCKSKLQFGNPIAMKPSYKETNNDDVEKEILRAKHYMNVPNISNGEKPKEMAVGALAVNPNTPDRIARCLDEVIDAADMKNKFSVKIVLNANSVEKVFNTNMDFRKFVVVTADGLPYKMIIDLIKNRHTCAICGKRLNYLAEITEHKKITTEVEED